MKKAEQCKVAIKAITPFKHEVVLSGRVVGVIAGSPRSGHRHGVTGGYNVTWAGETPRYPRWSASLQRDIYDFAYFKDAVKYVRSEIKNKCK